VPADQEGWQVRPMVPEGIDAEEFQKIHESSNNRTRLLQMQSRPQSVSVPPLPRPLFFASSSNSSGCSIRSATEILELASSSDSSYRRTIHSPKIRPRSCNSPTRTHPWNHPSFPHQSRTRDEPSRQSMK
jgi:hypothetical protein